MCPDDGNVCNGAERCDRVTNTCVSLAPLACDDGLVCNGLERCDSRRGCVVGEPIACDLPNTHCEESTASCECDEPYLAPDCTVKTAYFAQFGRVLHLAEELDTLWVGTETGLYAVDYAATPGDARDDVWVHFPEILGFEAKGGIALHGSDAAWFAARGKHPLTRLLYGRSALDRADDQWSRYSYERTLTHRGFAVDSGERVWLGNFGETLVFSDGESRGAGDDAWSTVSDWRAPDVLSDLNNVDSILAGPDGVVWLGSSSGGLFTHVDTGSFAQLEVGTRVLDLAYRDGTLWYVAQGSGDAQTGTPLVVRRLGELSDPTDDQTEAFPSPSRLSAVDVDEAGLVWSVTAAGGLGCFEPPTDAASFQWAEESYLDQEVSAVHTRSAESVWLGTRDGVVHLAHDRGCSPETRAISPLIFEQGLRSPAADVDIEGDGVWFATDRGVDYLDTGGTPFERSDDRWAHFDASDVPGLSMLQGVIVRADGVKFFWGDSSVFALDDGASPWDKNDDHWVAHPTEVGLWVSGVLDADGRLIVVARTPLAGGAEPRLVVFDPGVTLIDSSDDEVVTLRTGLGGMGRSMAVDTAGEIWLGTEGVDGSGNLYHWHRGGTPFLAEDDVWTAVRAEGSRVWKLVADPTGGIWGTAGGSNPGVFHFFDGGTPADLLDDYWHTYPTLGSAMEIGPKGNGWFRIPGGAAILNVNGTPRDAADDVQIDLPAPEGLRFRSDLYTNGAIDNEGRFWIVDEQAQVFEPSR